MRRRSLTNLVGLLLLATACSSSSSKVGFEVYFEAKTDTGEALGGVEITGNGRALGVTGEDGVLRAFLRAREGTSLRTEASCPEGYREPIQPALLRLRRFRAVDLGTTDQKLQVSIECRATDRMVALVVNTDRRADLPVIMDGREIGYTNSEGVAHIALTMAPNTTFRVALDTSDQTALRPNSPTATFTVGDADTMVVFDQAFAEKVKPKKKRRHKKKVVPPPEDPRPTKLTAPKRTWRRVR